MINDEFIGPGGLGEISVSNITEASAKGPPLGTIINTGASGSKNNHEFQEKTKIFQIKTEKVVDILYNFNETDFDNNILFTITSGGAKKETGLYLDAGVTIYFKVNMPNVDVEIEEWS